MVPNTSELCNEFQPQLAAYALGERDIDADVRAHMLTCATCQQSLRAYAQIAQILPYDAPDVAPSAALRERIIAAAAPPPPPAIRPARRTRRVSTAWAAWACALLVAIGLLGWNVSLRNQVQTQAAQITRSREGWQTMIVLLNNPAVTLYPLTGDQANGHLWAAPGGTAACLVIQGLPALAANQVYQVWLTRDGKTMSGGTFNERNGNAWILVHTPDPLTSYPDISVTVEPSEGSQWPNGPNVLTGKLVAAASPDAAARLAGMRVLEEIGPNQN